MHVYQYKSIVVGFILVLNIAVS